MMPSFSPDLRFALRVLSRNPGFTAVAVLKLALGIGTTTTVLRIVHDVILAKETVIILGHDLWQRRFNADPNIIGKAVSLGRWPALTVIILKNINGHVILPMNAVAFRWSFAPATLIGAAFLFATAGLLACWLPARRASKVDPMEALRHE